AAERGAARIVASARASAVRRRSAGCQRSSVQASRAAATASSTPGSTASRSRAVTIAVVTCVSLGRVGHALRRGRTVQAREEVGVNGTGTALGVLVALVVLGAAAVAFVTWNARRNRTLGTAAERATFATLHTASLPAP